MNGCSHEPLNPPTPHPPGYGNAIDTRVLLGDTTILYSARNGKGMLFYSARNGKGMLFYDAINGKGLLFHDAISMFLCACFDHRSGFLHYVDPAGMSRTYETVERTTRNEHAGVDGIDIISMSKR